MNDAQTKPQDVLTPREVALREQRRAEMEQTSFQTGSQGGALMQPRNGRELMDMANTMAGAKQMVRDFYRDSPGDCAALIMICQPYGFNPYQVSWKTYKASKTADAPVSFEGQLVNAMVNMSAPVRGRLKYSFSGEGQMRTCTVTGIDRETGDEITYTSPVIKDIKVKNSPLWTADPDQQLGYFSARAWARRHFPELLLGVYTREEIEEAPPRDITPKATGGFVAKAAAAKAAAVDMQADPSLDTVDAEIVQDQPHWTEGVDWDEGAPGSKAWDDGMAAFKSGAVTTDCPYDGDLLAATDWLAAWHGAQRAAE